MTYVKIYSVLHYSVWMGLTAGLTIADFNIGSSAANFARPVLLSDDLPSQVCWLRIVGYQVVV